MIADILTQFVQYLNYQDSSQFALVCWSYHKWYMNYLPIYESRFFRNNSYSVLNIMQRIALIHLSTGESRMGTSEMTVINSKPGSGKTLVGLIYASSHPGTLILTAGNSTKVWKTEIIKHYGKEALENYMFVFANKGIYARHNVFSLGKFDKDSKYSVILSKLSRNNLDLLKRARTIIIDESQKGSLSMIPDTARIIHLTGSSVSQEHSVGYNRMDIFRFTGKLKYPEVEISVEEGLDEILLSLTNCKTLVMLPSYSVIYSEIAEKFNPLELNITNVEKFNNYDESSNRTSRFNPRMLLVTFAASESYNFLAQYFVIVNSSGQSVGRFLQAVYRVIRISSPFSKVNIILVDDNPWLAQVRYYLIQLILEIPNIIDVGEDKNMIRILVDTDRIYGITNGFNHVEKCLYYYPSLRSNGSVLKLLDKYCLGPNLDKRSGGMNREQISRMMNVEKIRC